MDWPSRTAIQSGRLPVKQSERISWIRHRLVGFADDHPVDTHAACQDPLFGPAPGRVRMMLEQPLQQRAAHILTGPSSRHAPMQHVTRCR